MTGSWQLGSGISLDEIALGLRFLRDLPGHLRRPISREEALQILSRRLRKREVDFLALARETIYRNPLNPYRALLARVGCEYGDVVQLVRQEGLEGALRALYGHGVYLTVDEAKGRCPAVRGSDRIEVDPAQLNNPLTGSHFLAQTGGSSGRSSVVPVDLASVRDRAVSLFLALDARGGGDWVKATWGVPGRSVLGAIHFSMFGSPLSRFFLLVSPETADLHPRYRWSLRAMRLGGRLAGRRLPHPEVVQLSDPLPVARWAAAVLTTGATPHLFAFASAAVRLCDAAREGAVDLAGLQMTITGEPITAARLATIRRAGADAVPDYGSAECGGSISHGCLAPQAPDDVHFFHDLHALVQADDGTLGGPRPGTLLVTSLRRTSPLILLNVSMGDRATVVERACGCPLERLGWTIHLHTIRSFEKLTAGGMTLLDSDVVRILEEVLPSRFGGGPLDYQLVEDQDAREPGLRLLVNPRLGPLDTAHVAETFLAAIAGGSDAERLMIEHWRAARLLRVERCVPLPTSGGKILHLHRHARQAPLPLEDAADRAPEAPGSRARRESLEMPPDANDAVPSRERRTGG